MEDILWNNHIQEQAVFGGVVIRVCVRRGPPFCFKKSFRGSYSCGSVESFGIAPGPGIHKLCRCQRPFGHCLGTNATLLADLYVGVSTCWSPWSPEAEVADWSLGISDVGEVIQTGVFLHQAHVSSGRVVMACKSAHVERDG